MLHRPLARRTALLATAAMTGLATSACTSDSPADPSDPTSTSAPPVDADQVLADSVVERLTAALSAVLASRDSSPALARELRGLERMHVAHLETLGADTSSVAPAADQALDRRRMVAEERRVQQFLTHAAVRAESGILAKLLASMSAAVAQHVAVLG